MWLLGALLRRRLCGDLLVGKFEEVRNSEVNDLCLPDLHVPFCQIHLDTSWLFHWGSSDASFLWPIITFFEESWLREWVPVLWTPESLLVWLEDWAIFVLGGMVRSWLFLFLIQEFIGGLLKKICLLNIVGQLLCLSSARAFWKLCLVWWGPFYAHFVHWWIASIEVGAQSPRQWKGWWGFLIARRPFVG